GGPGSAAVCCNDILEPYLPVPTVNHDPSG
ncbi:unnamed protein product, partial [marine sediment metagenome]